MRVFILLGHPNTDTLSGHLATIYEEEAKKAGHEVRRMNIGEMQFDPILHKGYKERMDLEPDLTTVRDNITWCEHLVIVYPNWWGGMPALFKGMWDRAFLPHFAFSMHKNHLGWDQLLKGRTARVIILASNPPILDYLAFGDFTASIKRSLLEFSGIRTSITTLGPSEKISDSTLTKWEKKMAAFARKAN